MNITMQSIKELTLDDMKDFLEGSRTVDFDAEGRLRNPGIPEQRHIPARQTGFRQRVAAQRTEHVGAELLPGGRRPGEFRE